MYSDKSSAKAKAALSCSGCLREVEVDLVADTVLTFVPRGAPEAEDEVEPGAEDLDLYFYREDSLSLRDAVRDQLILAVPLQPLCKPE
ncbi:MAG: DUF177 domain-containing protein, partial [Nitrospinota bacterium]